MTYALAAPFLATLGLVALSRIAGGRAHPRHLARFLTLGSVAVSLSTTAALALLAWPLIARVSFVAQVGGWRPRSVGRGVGIPELISLLALLLLAGLAVLVIRSINATAAQVWRLGTMHRTLAGSGRDPLVVIDDELPLAYAAPAITAAGGRTVVSAGLLEALDPDECDAVVAHERAHLNHYHHLFTYLIGLAVSLNPAIAPAARRARYELERWADEDAVTATSRATVARALAKTALARLEANRNRPAVEGLYLQVGRYRVSDRIEALLDSRTPPERVITSGMFLMPAAVGLVATVLAAHNMELAFEAIRRLG